MDASLGVALIMSGGALVTSVWALLTAKATRKRVLEAEIEVKHSEEVRSKGIDIFSTMLQHTVEYSPHVEGAIFLIKLGAFNTNEFNNQFYRAATSLSNLKKYALENAFYLPENVMTRITTMGEKLLGLNITNDRQTILLFLDDLKIDSQKLYTYLLDTFRQTYL